LVCCFALWQDVPNTSLRCEAIELIGVTNFVGEHANSSQQADAILSPFLVDRWFL
jgi:hypothetical protein